MAKVYLNPNDIKVIIDSYKKENETFVVKSFSNRPEIKICKFFIEGKECRIDFYIKKDYVNILPVGNNIEQCNLLVEFVASKGYSKNVESKQFIIPCEVEVLNSLIKFIDEECIGIVTHSSKDGIHRFKGYNGDVVTFTYYPTTNKAMIQARPFMAYSIVMTFLSELPQYTFEQIVEINNTFTDKNTPSSSIREEIKNKLGKAYFYLDEALIKSISGSISFLKQRSYSEDYSGCVTGSFKALEGYLKKILVKKYKYILKKSNTFSMFYVKNGCSQIDKNTKLSISEKKELKKLYLIYSSKRNVYLHATIDPSQTRIIPTLIEAQNLSDGVLKAIRESYQVIFR